MKENINDSILGKYVIVRTRFPVTITFYEHLSELLHSPSSLQDIHKKPLQIVTGKQDKSKICSPIKALWSEAAEIIPVTDVSKESLLNCPEAEQEII